MSLLPQPVGLPILPLFLILFIGYRTGVVVSPTLSSNFYHTVACTRRRTGGCGKSTRTSLFSRPLRTTVTRLISAPCKTSSGRREIYLVLRYCSMFQSSSRTGCSCSMTSSQNAMCLRTKPAQTRSHPRRRLTPGDATATAGAALASGP